MITEYGETIFLDNVLQLDEKAAPAAPARSFLASCSLSPPPAPYGLSFEPPPQQRERERDGEREREVRKREIERETNARGREKERDEKERKMRERETQRPPGPGSRRAAKNQEAWCIQSRARDLAAIAFNGKRFVINLITLIHNNPNT